MSSANQIASMVDIYAGQMSLSIRIAQRIINKKKELGRFQDLHQVATVPGIGDKKFTSIINALSNTV